MTAVNCRGCMEVVSITLAPACLIPRIKPEPRSAGGWLAPGDVMQASGSCDRAKLM